jgi:phosphopantetheinyl transferase (holo-ACP synthase)
MPLIDQILISENNLVAIWHITESSEELKLQLTDQYDESEKETRINGANALHWLASRCLIQQVFSGNKLRLEKDYNNHPTLFVNNTKWQISITHAAEMAGIYISKNKHIGIDLEQIDARILRVSNKFMNENELAFAGNTNQIAEMTLIWSAKETLYKLYNKKELDFKKHLLIEPFSLVQTENFFFGTINKDNLTKKQKIHFKFYNQIILTYTSEKDAEN